MKMWKASLIIVLLVCVLLAFTVSGAFAQTVSSNRAPSATGSVVDYAPFDWSGPAEGVESGMLIGNINDTVRKAVLEYDISDLSPGVVDSARLTGKIGPNNSAPAGDRSHYFRVSVGNGVVDVSDSIPGYPAGSFTHSAGTRTSYDHDITASFRSVMLSDPDYLCQLISPSGNEQGWDAVYSTFPEPQLELQVRTTSASTIVYYQTPTAAAAAHAEGGGAFTLDTSASRAEVMDWSYAPYEQGRGLMEFDVSSIPAGATIQWAKLDVHLNGLQTGGWGTIGPNLEIMGYSGDGVATTGDIDEPGVLLGTSGQLLSTGPWSWDIDADLVESLLGADSYLGVRIQPGDRPGYRAIFVLDSLLSPGSEPHLVIAYEIPEPATLPGDFNLDDNVDGVDFAYWQIGYPTASGATLSDGDADGDGDVDGVDFGIWQANYPTNLGGSAAIPEPATLAVLLAGSLALLRRKP